MVWYDAFFSQYIWYTPSQQWVAFHSGAKQRIFQMVEMRSPQDASLFFKILEFKIQLKLKWNFKFWMVSKYIVFV